MSSRTTGNESDAALDREGLPTHVFTLGIGLCVIAYAAICVWAVWPHTPVDDAYITFRYAKNLAAGHGAVFNPGERVEGFTSWSWLLAMAATQALGFSQPVVSKVLGLTFGIVTILLMARAPISREARLWAAAIWATFLPAAYHSLNGLETSAMTLLVTAMLCLPGEGRKWRAALCVVAALLVLTRPEGLAAVLVFSWLAWYRGRRSILDASAPAASAVVAFLFQLVARRAYYGEWIATSARAKLLPPGLALPHGLRNLNAFFFGSNGSPFVAALVVVGIVLASASAKSRARQMRVIAGFVVVFALLLASSGGDSFPMWRFFVPVAPPLFLVAGSAIPWLRCRAARVSPKAAVAVAVFVLVGIAGPAPRWSANLHKDVVREGQWRAHWSGIGRALARSVPPETTMALCPVGALPFESGLRTIDMLGLVNPEIARTPPDTSYYYPGHNRHDGAAVLRLMPDIIMLGNGPLSVRPDAPFPWSEIRIYERDVVESPVFRKQYRTVYLPLENGRFAILFARSGFRAVPGRMSQ